MVCCFRDRNNLTRLVGTVDDSLGYLIGSADRSDSDDAAGLLPPLHALLECPFSVPLYRIRSYVCTTQTSNTMPDVQYLHGGHDALAIEIFLSGFSTIRRGAELHWKLLEGDNSREWTD